MYQDFTNSSMFGYLIMIVVTSVLAFFSKLFSNAIPIIIGNIASAIVSFYFLYRMEITLAVRWDGNPLIIKQRNDNEDDEIINEIAIVAEVNKIINILKNADWEEHVEVDICPPDYYFSWNSYKHNVWVNEEYKKLELIIEGQSNYVSLPRNSSEILFDILAGKNFEND